ncbi:EAL domain-containing protein [Martelella limonii]|uniref:EAL domain-containing protein n=1 Tax=Martelella limonii TaxID=1647649 RepID=UPI00157FEEBC
MLASLCGLWVIEERITDATGYISTLADETVLVLATADLETASVIAQGLVATPEVRKIEIRRARGLPDIVLKDDDLTRGGEKALMALTRPITPAAGANQMTELSLYFVRPDRWICTILIGLCLLAFAFKVLLIWRAPELLQNLVLRRHLQATRSSSSVSRPRHRRLARILSPTEDAALPQVGTLGGLLESETDMAMLLSVHGKVVDVSPGWLKAGGYRRENVIGRPLHHFISDADRKMVTDRLERLTSSGVSQVGTLKFLARKGETIDIWFAASPVSTPDGQHFTLAIIRQLPEISEAGHPLPPVLTDQLTGLLNRMGFERALTRLLAAGGDEIICILADFDRFKLVIDHHGYETSEEVLRAFVSRLSAALDPVSLSARLGGDEFAFVIKGPNARTLAENFAAAIHYATYRPVLVRTHSVTVNIRVGIAIAPLHANTSETLMRNATIAVSAQKATGRQGTTWFQPAMLADTRKRAEIQADIQRGIEDNLFEPRFQPIISLASGRLVGFESLMRLSHPQKGVIMPNEFIAIAEETEQIGPAGRQFLAKALAGLRQISRHCENEQLNMSVNLSPNQLNPAMIDFVGDKLEAFGISPSRLTIEITEAVFIDDSDRIRESLLKLRALGCRLALDDFGTGYSSLSYLSRLQADIIKIDQSFTRNLTDPDQAVASRARRLIEGIAAISISMGCVLVAEGVENNEQARQVQAIGVQLGQGYLYARPMTLAQTVAWIRSS